MSEALYERYKDALRRGHVAALRGRHDAALDAYGEASRLAPDRALPFVGIGGVLTRLGRDADALAAYGAALDRAPNDEAALRGRADLRAVSGDRIGAAESLDRLASRARWRRSPGRRHRRCAARPRARRIARPAGHGPPARRTASRRAPPTGRGRGADVGDAPACGLP